MNKAIILIGLLVLVSGCVTQEERTKAILDMSKVSFDNGREQGCMEGSDQVLFYFYEKGILNINEYAGYQMDFNDRCYTTYTK